MSDLIDRDALIEKLESDREHFERIKDTVFAIATIGMINDIKKAPTIDAVEVVRCKDCKKWGYSAGLCRHWSKLYGSVLTRASDFCSYGERKENG